MGARLCVAAGRRKVVNKIIAVVIAIDVTASMTNHSSNLSRTAKTIVGSFLDNDRINAFGFIFGYPKGIKSQNYLFF